MPGGAGTGTRGKEVEGAVREGKGYGEAKRGSGPLLPIAAFPTTAVGWEINLR